MKIGSVAHKELFCRSFMETYREYDPKHLPWPELDDAALARLQRSECLPPRKPTSDEQVRSSIAATAISTQTC